MVTDSAIRNKCAAFSVRIMKLKTFLHSAKEFEIAGQVTRSGTAIGALVEEAQYAESRADFIHKMKIALKEANETAYWLDLLHNSAVITDIAYHSIKKDVEEIKLILICIINTGLKNMQQ